MKKSFQLLIILLLVSLGLVAIGNRVVMGSAEKVIVEERASFGDKEVAEGLRVNIPVSTIVGYRGDRRGHLLWDTEFVIGESPTVKTEAELSIDAEYGHNLYQYRDSGVYISTDVEQSYYVPNVGMEAWENLDEVYTDIAVQTTPEGFWQKIVCMNDYYEKYPLSVEVYIDDRKYGSEFGYWADLESTGEGIKNIGRNIEMKLLPEYLYSVQMSVSKDTEGNVTGYGCTTTRASAGIFSVSDVTDTDIYYGADVRALNGGRPQAVIGDGYGIWRIGYELIETEVDEQINREFRFTEIEPKLIWPMEPEEILLDVRVSEDQQELLLFTGENGMCVLTVIDVETVQELQRLDLMPYDTSPEYTPGMRRVLQTENVIVPFLTEGDLAVISKSAAGEYALEFIIDKEADCREEAVNYIEEKHGKTATLWNRLPASIEIAWKDGKLAMVYALTNSYGSGKGCYYDVQPCAFWVAVYGQTGLLYGGEYYLSQGISEYRDVNHRISEIRDDAKMGVHWNEE